MSQHLGDLAAALVDNALSHDARDKALAHLTRCPECRAEVDSQRRLRSLLANQPDPEPPAGLAARLRDIAAAEPFDGVRRPPARRMWPLLGAAAFAPSQTRPAGVRRPGDSAPTGRPVQVRARRTVRRALAGGAAALALTAGLAAAGGPTSARGPATTPPVDRFVQEHTVMTARLPFGDAGAGLVESVVIGR
ncbi:MAG: hypothetical protein QOG49_962 [Frankiaceae bacterium]|nr:hypothetical protein [Frankiaceae bacterium]